MKLRWNFRCYPTPEQEFILTRTFGCCRYVYNWGLDLRSKAFKDGKRVGYHETSAELTKLKRTPEHSWLYEVSSVPVQQSLRQLQVAYVNFFEKRAGYPKFRRRDGKQSAQYTGGGFQYDTENKVLKIAKLGKLKVKWSRDVQVLPSSVTIIKKPTGKFYISMVVDVNPVPLPETGKDVGIDFGINRLATLDDGTFVANPRYTRKYEKKLARAQRKLARKKLGSNRRAKAKIRVAKIHEKIADSRKDVQAKLAWKLVQKYDRIFVEDLNLRGMVKNHNLAKSLSDASIGSAIRTIEYKAVMHGKQVLKIDRWFPSSKMCSACGVIRESLPLSVREWDCECGVHHDRDHNAAKNISAVGQTVAAQGGGVRAARSSRSGSQSLVNCEPSVGHL